MTDSNGTEVSSPVVQSKRSGKFAFMNIFKNNNMVGQLPTILNI